MRWQGPPPWQSPRPSSTTTCGTTSAPASTPSWTRRSDPLGAGYNIIQSKIALGSGGIWGKGFLQGTQGHLNFLPEKQTDFIFTMIAEEFGLVGALTTLGLLMPGGGLLLPGGAAFSKHQFGRLLGIGLGTNYFLYIFVNVAMVTGSRSRWAACRCR